MFEDLVDTSNVNLALLRKLQQVARDHLGKAYAEGLLDTDELDRRLEALENANDPATVRKLFEDVVLPDDRFPVPVAEPQSTALATVSDAAAESRVVTIFGESKRTGAWHPARQNQVRTIFGSTRLDFREAHLPEGTTEVRVNLIMGELEILVPPGLAVHAECSVIFGEVNVANTVTSASTPGGPRLLITGRVIFGEVGVFERLRGESRREAKRRRKVERKRLKQAERKRRRESKR